MAYTAADSYTTQARVEGLVRRGVFTASTTPTSQEVLDRMAQQGALVTACLRKWGHEGTPTSVAADTGGDGLVIKVLCDEANAFLAGAHVLDMNDVTDTDRDRYDAMLAAAARILGTAENGFSGTLSAVLVGSGLVSGGAVVNENIEILREDLLHVTTMRN